MENNYISNKLEYIYELNKNKLLNKSRSNESNDFETDIDSTTNGKTIKECISFYKNKLKIESKDQLSLAKLSTLDKKLRVLEIYLNLILFTISVKYLDIIIRVKNGGIIWMFYFSNKKFKEYQNYLIIKELAQIDKTSPNQMLYRYMNIKRLQSDEEKLRKVSLKKYWKEPMAWH